MLLIVLSNFQECLTRLSGVIFIRTYCTSMGTSLFADWNESLPFLLSFSSNCFDIAKVQLIFVFAIAKALIFSVLTHTENY